MNTLKRILISGIIVCLALSFPSYNTSAENSGFVTTDGRHLSLNDNDFYYNGANQYYLFYKSDSMVDEVFADASALGLNAIRVWGFCDGVYADGFSFQPEPGVYNENTFLKMDYIIYKANQMDIRLIIPLVNNWNDFGGMNKYVEWSSGAVTHDDFYTDETCKTMYRNYVQHFLNRVNTYTGIAYKDDPTIMIWELANEPRCESDTTGNTLYNWIVEMAAFVKSIDQNHLVSTGEEGWYVDKGADWKYNGFEGADFIRNSQCANIDVCTFHLYPQNFAMTEAEAMIWIDEHIDDAHFIIQKPVYLGEFGWRAPREVLGNFSLTTETWRVDWGYDISGPQRVETPSYGSNGAIEYNTAGTLEKFQTVAGERYLDSGFDFREYDIITAQVYIPNSAPRGLKASIFTKSGDSWTWDEGSQVSLSAGTWTQVSFSAANISAADQVMSIGIKISNGPKKYTGPIYYDSITASSEGIGETISDRNRVYADWLNNMDLKDADGALVWILSGHREDTALYPDYDNYTVYFPEDTETSDAISNYSDIVTQKNNSQGIDEYPVVNIQTPVQNQIVTDTVIIQSVATDDVNVDGVSYSVDGEAYQPMTYIMNDIWEVSWDSTTVDDGQHTIAVRATDTASQNSYDSVNVNVSNDGIPEDVMYIAGIDLTIYTAGKSGRRHCGADVYVLDTAGNPVPDATVYAQWSGGLVSDSDVATSDSTGLATLSSDSAKATSGTFVVTVTDIVKNGYTYNSSLNVETSDQISF